MNPDIGHDHDPAPGGVSRDRGRGLGGDPGGGAPERWAAFRHPDGGPTTTAAVGIVALAVLILAVVGVWPGLVVTGG